MDLSPTERIRALNDRLRTARDPIAALMMNGSLVITAGIVGEGPAFVVRCVAAVRAFADFTPQNDPHGEHDMAFLTIDGRRIFFKVDYFDRELEYLSPDPADAGVTRRVLTIALADEY